MNGLETPPARSRPWFGGPTAEPPFSRLSALFDLGSRGERKSARKDLARRASHEPRSRQRHRRWRNGPQSARESGIAFRKLCDRWKNCVNVRPLDGSFSRKLHSLPLAIALSLENFSVLQFCSHLGEMSFVISPLTQVCAQGMLRWCNERTCFGFVRRRR